MARKSIPNMMSFMICHSIVRRVQQFGGSRFVLSSGRAILVGLLMSGYNDVRGETVTLQPDADTTIISDEATIESVYKNWGVRDELFASYYCKPTVRGAGEYILLRFDLSSIPKDAIIKGATLKLVSARDVEVLASINAILKVWQISPENKEWNPGDSNGEMTMGATGGYKDQAAYTDVNTHAGQNWVSGGPFNLSAGDLGDELGSVPLPLGKQLDKAYVLELDPSAITRWLTDADAQKAGLAVHLQTTAEDVCWLGVYSTRSDQPSEKLPQLIIAYDKKK